MPTSNQRVSGYPSDEVYQALLSYKDSNRLRSVSEAVNRILEEFLLGDRQVNPTSSDLEQRMIDLEGKSQALLNK